MLRMTGTSPRRGTTICPRAREQHQQHHAGDRAADAGDPDRRHVRHDRLREGPGEGPHDDDGREYGDRRHDKKVVGSRCNFSVLTAARLD